MWTFSNGARDKNGRSIWHRCNLPNDVTVYAIDDGKYLWVVSRRITKKNQKPLDVTVNAPVKFAIQTNDCYLIDDEGKEHKLVVEKKTLKAN